MDKFIQLEKPFFHLTAIERNDLEKLCTIYDNEGLIVRVIDGNKCTTVNETFAQFSKEFEFPDYFAYNWMAFDECINDLDWLEGEAYLLILTNVDKIITTLGDNFDILIETLIRCNSEWTEGRCYDDFPTKPTPFHVVFQCSLKKISEVKSMMEIIGVKDMDLLSNKI